MREVPTIIPETGADLREMLAYAAPLAGGGARLDEQIRGYLSQIAAAPDDTLVPAFRKHGLFDSQVWRAVSHLWANRSEEETLTVWTGHGTVEDAARAAGAEWDGRQQAWHMSHGQVAEVISAVAAGGKPAVLTVNGVRREISAR